MALRGSFCFVHFMARRIQFVLRVLCTAVRLPVVVFQSMVYYDSNIVLCCTVLRDYCSTLYIQYYFLGCNCHSRASTVLAYKSYPVPLPVDEFWRDMGVKTIANISATVVHPFSVGENGTTGWHQYSLIFQETRNQNNTLDMPMLETKISCHKIQHKWKLSPPSLNIPHSPFWCGVDDSDITNFQP
jgi:hypothetical protein